MESLLHYVETGVKEGAKLIFGGKRLDRKGVYFELGYLFAFSIYWIKTSIISLSGDLVSSLLASLYAVLLPMLF